MIPGFPARCSVTNYIVSTVSVLKVRIATAQGAVRLSNRGSRTTATVLPLGNYSALLMCSNTGKLKARRSRPQGPIPQTSNPTQANSAVAVPAFFGPGKQRGSLSNVGHGAEEPSYSVSSR